MTVYDLYDEIAELIAGLNPDKVKSMKASDEMRQRLEYLIEKSKNNQIDRKEKDELDHYIVLERLIRLAKLRTSKRLAA